MVVLGIGVKVATLPVIALGVGIGVDYALYLLSVQLAQQRAGLPLTEAYKNAVQFTGKVVALVGVTLAAGVITWAFSPIKFQADMGILLTFMFLWNMLGALVLIPALSYFLLPTSIVRRRRALITTNEATMATPRLHDDDARAVHGTGNRRLRLDRRRPAADRRVRRLHGRSPVDPCRRRARAARKPVRRDDRARLPDAVARRVARDRRRRDSARRGRRAELRPRQGALHRAGEGRRARAQPRRARRGGRQRRTAACCSRSATRSKSTAKQSLR